jgi:hypothetical protein
MVVLHERLPGLRGTVVVDVYNVIHEADRELEEQHSNAKDEVCAAWGLAIGERHHRQDQQGNQYRGEQVQTA